MRHAPARLIDYARCEDGASALEFGLVLPILCLTMLGAISMSLLGGAVSGLHYAVEEAARCYAVNKVACASGSAAEAYALDKYIGPKMEPVFVASNGGCGFTVSGTATFALQLAVLELDVPLSASACYPGKSA